MNLPGMRSLLAAIVRDDRKQVSALLKADAALATCLASEARLYETGITHWLYAGDTALHLASAGYRSEIVQLLLAAGADVNAATNHRRSRPLHYAADGCITCPDWDAERQVRTIRALLDAGANVDAQDKNGATPLHRAVRTRCAAAVHSLLSLGADPQLRNKSGSAPFHLAVQNTGRGGSGERAAKDAQRRIIAEFLARGMSTAIQDGKRKSVLECATSEWVRTMLAATAASRARPA